MTVIARFHHGLAGRIFDDVKKTGAKAVTKNNAIECVLLSPEEYLSLLEEVEDARLLLLAKERLGNSNPRDAIAAEDVYRELGISSNPVPESDDSEPE